MTDSAQTASLDEAFGQGNGTSSSSSSSASASSSGSSATLDEAFGVKPAVTSQSSATSTAKPAAALKSALTPVTGWWAEYNHQIESSLQTLAQAKADITAPQESKIIPTQGLKGIGEGLLGLLQMVWSPGQATVKQFASKPSATVISGIGSMLPVAPDLKPGEKRPAFDPTIRRSDVIQNTDALNNFMDTLYSTAAGFVGAGPTIHPEAGRGAMSLLTPEARAEMKARPERAHSTISAAFDELAVTEPQTAYAIADTTGRIDPKLAKAMRERTGKMSAIPASPELEAIGSQIARGKVVDMEIAKHAQNEAMLKAEQFRRLAMQQKQDPKAPPPPLAPPPKGPLKDSMAPEVAAAKEISKAVETGVKEGKSELKSTTVGNFQNFLKDYVPSQAILDKHHPLKQFGITEEKWNEPTEVKIFPVNETWPSHQLDAATFIPGKQYFHATDPKQSWNKADKKAWSAAVKAENERIRREKKSSPAHFTVVIEDGLSHKDYGKYPTREAAEHAVGLLKSQGKLPGNFAPIGKSRSETYPYEKAAMDTLDSWERGGSLPKELATVTQLKPKGPSGGGTVLRSGIPIDAIFDMTRRSKAGQIMEGKLREYYDFTIRNINPEALGPEAKKGAAILAKGIAQLAHEDSSFIHRAEQRRLFWERNNKISKEFISGFEQGKRFKNDDLNVISTHYTDWNRRILDQDRRNGIDYDPVDHYLSHTFENPKGVQDWLFRKFGSSWTKPGFTKDRGFNLYEEAEKAGFKAKFTNPEDIMLMRQHASDVAQMKVEALRELERQGLAFRKGAKMPDHPVTAVPSPAGGSYWVHSDAYQVLHNAFNTQSMWTMKGPVGDAFRGTMALKNALIPVKLGLSLFHPLHVQTIDNATAMVRASKELLAGTQDPAKWLYNMARAATYKGIWDNPKAGGRILRAFQGKVKDGELTSADKQSIKYMAEGGFIPEMSSQYRMKALDNYKMAVARNGLREQWRAPFAAYDWLQGQVFQHWIPSLKIASYLQDVKTAIKTNPELLTNDMDRMLAFRKIAKSVDNRYGEMAYNTMFWNRWVKDIAVANTLSLGWQLGFIREYGGGMLDVGQALTREGSIASKAKSGMLDRPLFVTFYTAQALGYGGLMTWAMTGKSPASLMDYIYPKTGEQNKDGSDARVSTMFYPKEFASVEKHIELQGAASGTGGLIASKSSGLFGLAYEGAKGVNSWGDEIRDPEAPFYKQLGQTMSSMMPELLPISVGQVSTLPGKGFVEKVSDNPWKATGSFAGFNPAPKYITESATAGRIDQIYKTYYAPKQTPFEKAQYSQDARELKDLHEADDMDGFEDKLDSMQDRYKLDGTQLRKLRTNIQRGVDPNVKKFEGFSDDQKKKLLDKMTAEERETYLPHAGKRLRRTYEEPETEE